MFRKCFLAVVGFHLLAGSVHAANINLLTNGSFETGSLAGWTITGTLGTPPDPTTAIITDGVTGSAFGEAIPADNALGNNSSDAAGTYGAYFVDDTAHQILTQQLFLPVGSYEIGFDAYAPLNGFNNPVDAAFTGTIAGVELANYTVKTQNTPRVWINYNGVANILGAGLYNVAFTFDTKGIKNVNNAADVVIDRVYIAATDRTGGTDIPAVPEPATLSLLGLGLAAAGLRRRWAAK